ncbi:MAG: polyprenyl synthetase family protein [Cytophagales bacterium]
MMEINSLQNQINDALSKRNFGENPSELYEPIRYFTGLGGKRLRPILTILSHYMFSEEYLESFEPSLGVELFHNFTLLHDDIMDEAPLRRGKATVHEKWNKHIAILSGDAMLVKAYQSISAVNKDILPAVLNAFNKTGLEVCEGQQYDMNFESRNDISVDDYLEMIRLKTAVLLGFSLELGGIIAKADQERIEQLRSIGVNAGLGFQLKDDLLDLFGDKEKVGKQVGGDIISNKKTFLLLKALELANSSQRKELDNWLSLESFDETEKVESVKRIFTELHIDKITQELVNSYFDRSIYLLKSFTVSESRKQPLMSFLQSLMKRDS